MQVGAPSLAQDHCGLTIHRQNNCLQHENVHHNDPVQYVTNELIMINSQAFDVGVTEPSRSENIVNQVLTK
jgi:hypothetical protein